MRILAIPTLIRILAILTLPLPLTLTAILTPAIVQAQAISPDLTALTVDDSINHGKTLITAAGTWSFGPNVGPGGNEILINGNGSNAGNATFIQVGDTGKMFAHAADNSWWVYDGTPLNWHTSPGTPYVLTCVPPTTYLNGATINLHLTYTFTRGTTPKDFTTEVSTEPNCTHTYYGLQGVQYFSVTAKDPTNSESPLSSQLAVGITSNAPQAPTNLVVKGAAQVFAVKQSKDHLAATVPVGTIPLNTACDSTQRVNDMFIVPRDKVTWYGNVKPQAVVALCNVP